MRLRDDLLASTARLARVRRVGQNLAGHVGRTGTSRRVGVERRRARQLFGPRSFWGADTGPNPTDRGKTGSKRHLLTEGNGLPWAIEHTAANVHDSVPALKVVEQRPAIKQPRGPRRRRLRFLLADRAYDAEAKIRRPLREAGVVPLIAERNTEHGSGLGQLRYVVESCFEWLFQWRRLRVRYEKRSDIHTAFLNLACAMVCWNRIRAAKGFC
jgi:transposase